MTLKRLKTGTATKKSLTRWIAGIPPPLLQDRPAGTSAAIAGSDRAEPRISPTGPERARTVNLPRVRLTKTVVEMRGIVRKTGVISHFPAMMLASARGPVRALKNSILSRKTVAYCFAAFWTYEAAAVDHTRLNLRHLHAIAPANPTIANPAGSGTRAPFAPSGPPTPSPRLASSTR